MLGLITTSAVALAAATQGDTPFVQLNNKDVPTAIKGGFLGAESRPVELAPDSAVSTEAPLFTTYSPTFVRIPEFTVSRESASDKIIRDFEASLRRAFHVTAKSTGPVERAADKIIRDFEVEIVVESAVIDPKMVTAPDSAVSTEAPLFTTSSPTFITLGFRTPEFTESRESETDAIVREIEALMATGNTVSRKVTEVGVDPKNRLGRLDRSVPESTKTGSKYTVEVVCPEDTVIPGPTQGNPGDVKRYGYLRRGPRTTKDEL